MVLTSGCLLEDGDSLEPKWNVEEPGLEPEEDVIFSSWSPSPTRGGGGP